MELDIINDILSSTVSSFFGSSNKYSLAQSLPRNPIVLLKPQSQMMYENCQPSDPSKRSTSSSFTLDQSTTSSQLNISKDDSHVSIASIPSRTSHTNSQYQYQYQNENTSNNLQITRSSSSSFGQSSDSNQTKLPLQVQDNNRCNQQQQLQAPSQQQLQGVLTQRQTNQQQQQQLQKPSFQYNNAQCLPSSQQSPYINSSQQQQSNIPLQQQQHMQPTASSSSSTSFGSSLRGGQYSGPNVQPSKQPLLNNFTIRALPEQPQLQSQSQQPAIIRQLQHEEWIRIEAPLRLQEALIRLRLDARRIVSSTYVKDLPKDVLKDEKTKVKNELKLYDQAFENVFQIQPTREQKEPMRVLYTYYKHLKQVIGKFQQNNENIHPLRQQPYQVATLQKQPVQTTSTLATISSHISSHNNSLEHAILKTIDQTTTAHNNYQRIQPQLWHQQQQQQQFQQQVSIQQQQQYSHNNQQSFALRERTNQQSNSQSSQQALMQDEWRGKSNNTNNEKNFLGHMGVSFPLEYKENLQQKGGVQILQAPSAAVNFHHQSSNERLIVEQRIVQLKRRRGQLREQLQAYQDDFYRQHNRKIKYHKDINAIEPLYKEYKDIKREVQQLEQLL